MTEQHMINQRPAPRRRDIVISNGWAFIAGLRPVDLSNGRAHLPDGLEGQVTRVLRNCEALLTSAGMSKGDVVSVRVSLVDFPRFYERMWAVLDGFFPSNNAPTLTCVGVTHLERGALVEMDLIVRAGKPASMSSPADKPEGVRQA